MAAVSATDKRSEVSEGRYLAASGRPAPTEPSRAVLGAPAWDDRLLHRHQRDLVVLRSGRQRSAPRRPAEAARGKGAPSSVFPFSLLSRDDLPGPLGSLVRSFRGLTMSPPYPWGLWLYGRFFLEHGYQLPGDIIEFGVGRGGTSLFLATLAQWARKRVFSLDTFAGLPAPNPVKDNAYFKAGDYRPQSADGEQAFHAVVAGAGLTATVEALRGKFQDSIRHLPARQRFCFAHVDSDLYDSVRTSLEYVYPRLSPGGLLAIDDFFHPSQGALRATVEYFNGLKLRPIYHVVFPYGVCVVKGEPPTSARFPRAVDGNNYSLERLREDPALIQAVRQEALAHRRLWPKARTTQNAKQLLNLLSLPRERSSEIYTYWRVLEDYWDAISLDI